MRIYDRFIVFEGIDACGKGTQQKKLAEFIYDLSKENTVLMTRNPYMTPDYKENYKKIRGLLKTMKNPVESAEVLANLFINNRIVFSEKVLENSIKNNYFVLCDRYDLSTIAYQGGLQNLGFEKMIEKHERIILPGLTFLIDITAEEALKRIKKSKEHAEVFDNMKIDKIKELRKAYLELVNKDYLKGRKIIVINGLKSKEEVFEEVKKHFINHLNKC